MRHTHPSAVAARALALASVLLACGREHGGRGAAREGPYAAKVAYYVPRIERSTGLRFKRPPKIATRSKAQVAVFLQKSLDEPRAAEDLEGSERAYKLLGMLPDSVDLRDLLREVLLEQIVGYYDPSSKTLYVVEGAPEEAAGIVLSHELVHALQDQYMDLDSLQHARGDNDRAEAAQAVLEGQATYEQFGLLLGESNIAARLPGGWDQIRQAIRDQQGATPVLAKAPLVVQETLIFPYLSGAEFIRRFKEKRPGEVPFADMPVSTEQILHEDRYFGQRDTPVRVLLPLPKPGAKKLYDNDLGEFETRLFLFQHLHDQAASARGAAGWDGDRYEVVRTAKGDGIVWVTVWDTPVDAADFAQLLERTTTARYGGSVTRSATGARAIQGRGRTAAIVTRSVAGVPAVMFVDMPAGASTDVIDLSRVQLERRGSTPRH
ncbi:MAG: hypothetical protein NVS9B3_02790 [Gemmatimonadaceae bacterium]